MRSCIQTGQETDGTLRKVIEVKEGTTKVWAGLKQRRGTVKHRDYQQWGAAGKGRRRWLELWEMRSCRREATLHAAAMAFGRGMQPLPNQSSEGMTEEQTALSFLSSCPLLLPVPLTGWIQLEARRQGNPNVSSTEVSLTWQRAAWRIEWVCRGKEHSAEELSSWGKRVRRGASKVRTVNQN